MTDPARIALTTSLAFALRDHAGDLGEGAPLARDIAELLFLITCDGEVKLEGPLKDHPDFAAFVGMVQALQRRGG